MPTEKKRPSKRAKTVAKILSNSELMAAAKTAADAKTDVDFKPEAAPIKTSAANKLRPDKKRG